MEANTHWVINSYMSSLNAFQEKLDLANHTSNVISKGLNLAISCINVDLKELDDHVTHCCWECESNKIVINLCQAQVSKLEWLVEARAK